MCCEEGGPRRAVAPSRRRAQPQAHLVAAVAVAVAIGTALLLCKGPLPGEVFLKLPPLLGRLLR